MGKVSSSPLCRGQWPLLLQVSSLPLQLESVPRPSLSALSPFCLLLNFCEETFLCLSLKLLDLKTESPPQTLRPEDRLASHSEELRWAVTVFLGPGPQRTRK